MSVTSLYAIADHEALGGTGLVRAVEAMAEAGIDWIQLRAKDLPGEALRRVVARCRERLAGSPARLWLDDRADVAVLEGVDGVHVGRQDLPAAAVRRVVGAGMWIGSSTHDLAQVAAAAADPAVDVVAVGPIFATASKRRADPVVGLDLVREARRLTSKTVVAIGGIHRGNLASVLDAGADRVAVLGAICHGDVYANCRALLAAAGAAA